MNGCIPVDREGRVLFNDIIHSDARSSKECEQILEVFDGDAFFNITGNRVDPHYTFSKILWLKNHYPDIYRNTAYFLNSKDYIAYKLTGNLGITDYSDASLTCMLDIRKKNWAEELIREWVWIWISCPPLCGRWILPVPLPGKRLPSWVCRKVSL
ncbi:MAG: FGGY family carbohydrate kinase [Clostridia bacterium]